MARYRYFRGLYRYETGFLPLLQESIADKGSWGRRVVLAGRRDYMTTRLHDPATSQLDDPATTRRLFIQAPLAAVSPTCKLM